MRFDPEGITKEKKNDLNKMAKFLMKQKNIIN